MKLLAISGGPDSMLLLYKNRKKSIVVAHVNYHKRSDSDHDEKIVRDFCQKRNIPFEVLSIKEKPKGNFQNWARNIRYEFFQKIYKKYSCSAVLTAHHKDDFIETALLQQKSGKNPRYFGIKKKNKLFNMNINRPFVYKYFKSQILDILKKNDIKYAIDSSNEKPVFDRNKIRLELKGKTRKEKQDIFEWFDLSNSILKKKFKKIDSMVKFLEKHDYPLKVMRNMGGNTKEILYEILHNKFGSVRVSSNKLESLIDFINGNEGNRTFIVDNKNSILKKNGRLIYNTNTKT